eukprot:1618005-Rhodomonas_salina.2
MLEKFRQWVRAQSVASRWVCVLCRCNASSSWVGGWLRWWRAQSNEGHKRHVKFRNAWYERLHLLTCVTERTAHQRQRQSVGALKLSSQCVGAID